jgi:hypothetical protein
MMSNLKMVWVGGLSRTTEEEEEEEEEGGGKRRRWGVTWG